MDDQLIRLAVQHHQAGRLAQAEAIYRQILSREPNDPDALHLLGVVAHQTGHLDTAIDLISRSISVQPRLPDSHNNLGNALQEKGRLDEAIACYRRATQLKPDFAEALSNLGKVLTDRGQFEEAIDVCRQAIGLNPNYPDPLVNLGNALLEQRKYDEAIAAYQRAIQLRPDFAAAHYNLGNALFQLRRLDAAIASYQKAIQLKADYADAHNNLGIALVDKKQLDEAVASYRRAIQIRPDFPSAQTNLGHALLGTGQYDEAIATFQKVIQLHPGVANAHNGLAYVYMTLGGLDDSIREYRGAMELKPDQPIFHSNLIFATCFHPAYDAKAILREARQWDQRHGQRVRSMIKPHRNPPDPNRRLKIGYVSGDFRKHVVGWNLLPLLREHDRGQFETYCYNSTIHPGDDVTQQLRAASDHWHEATPLSDPELADQIRSDGIDILVDLSLHTAYNRLVVFAMEPAPVQITYLGYCSTSGLQAMHYRLSDPYFDPSGQDLSDYSEQTLRLPRTYWCYEPGGTAPEVSPPPMQTNGIVTFGCMNQFFKVSSAALDLWNQILLAVPRSRLLIHAPLGSHLKPAIGRLCRDGVATDRVEFIRRQSWHQYMGTFDRIDIALDPMPYNGGITTCDTLWMGVPVVTLSGNTSVGRAGRSILSNIGLADLIAHDSQEYVRLATDLAANLIRLFELRRTMRERMKSSPLMDKKTFALDVQSAFRKAWQKWCLGRS